MKNFKLSFIFIETFSMLGLALFLYYICFHMNNYEKQPFGLEKSYIKISATYLHHPDETTMNELNAKFRDILSQDNATVILDNSNLQGLGLYDTASFYANSIIDGEYFDETEFLKGSSNILTNESSVAYSHYLSKTDYYSHHDYFHIKGILSQENPLITKEHTYVYSLLTIRDFNGDYYLNLTDEPLANSIYTFLDKNGFQTEMNYVNKENGSFFDLFTWINTQKYVPLMEIGVLTIYFNTFLFYIYFLFREKKPIYVRKLVGANNRDIYLYYAKKILLNSVIGTLFALLLYHLIFQLLHYQDTVFTPVILLSGAAFFHVFFTFIIFTATFFSTKTHQQGGYLKL